MKIALQLVLIGLFCSISPLLVIAQNKIPNNKAFTEVKAIKKDKFVRIQPPHSFYEKSTPSANFVVTYHNFTLQAKTAFQQAVDIWSTLISSNQPIYIDAYWEVLEENTLGSAGPTNFVSGYDGMGDASTYYPIALAEKLSEQNLNNPDEADIIAFFNSDADWYYGIDGNTSSGTYDLVSVVLHELCHGLGFTGSIEVEGNIAYWGWGDQNMFVFEKFLFDDQNQSILNTNIYPNGSEAFKAAVAGSKLYFDAPITRSEYGEKVELYSPTDWDEGSSVYHLNTSFDGSANDLMTHSINSAMSIHDPGVIATSILYDIGWKSILIKHSPLISRETIEDIRISCSFDVDYNTNPINPTLHYCKNKSDFIETTLLANNETGKYEATIPIAEYTEIEYYLTVKDNYGRTFRLPATSPDENFKVNIGPDEISPIISHMPTNFIIEGQQSIIIEAKAYDNYGVKNVISEIFLNEQSLGEVQLFKNNSNEYNVQINIENYNLKAGDYIKYKLTAFDIAANENSSSYPETGFVEMRVEEEKEYIDSISNQFEAINSDFVLSGFEINYDENFPNGILQTEHPYREGEENSSYEYTATTRYPVLISESRPYLTFDELVLVEPGEEGTVYGDEEFYDYVIVEAKIDGTSTWVPLVDGYDSSLKTDWNNAYFENVLNGSSITSGTQNLMRTRTINFSENESFKAGDKVYLRFRLYSDPYSNGWGWAIDNVELKTVPTGLNKIALKQFKVYPNPTNNQINININSSNSEEIELVSLFDLMGLYIATLQRSKNNQFIIPQLPSGNYLIKIQTQKYSQVQQLIIR